MTWRWPNFSEAELRCKHCGLYRMDDGFMDRLQAIRDVYARPMIISSAYRCPDHNVAVSTTGLRGPHTTGKAVDVLVHGAHAIELITIALEYGIEGLGVSQHGPHQSRFVHFDQLGKRLWSY